MAIKVENVCRIVDVHHEQLQPATVEYLKKAGYEYEDTNDLNEHIYSLETILEEVTDEDSDSPVLQELEALNQILKKRNAGLLRIIFM